MVRKKQSVGKERSVRVGRLHCVGAVVTELSKIYREARRGELDDVKAVRLANILLGIRQSMEGSEFERRMESMERDLAEAVGRRPVPIPRRSHLTVVAHD
jgi:hypothetical protein